MRSRDEGRTWLLKRLEEEALIDHVVATMDDALEVSYAARIRMALRNFSKALTLKDRNDSLTSFLSRLRLSTAGRNRSPATDEARNARDELDAYLHRLESGARPRVREAKALESSLNFLLDSFLKGGEVDFTQAAVDHPALLESKRLRPLLPGRERDLIDSVELHGACYPELVFFSTKLLLDGHGGLTGWLAMYKDGRESLAQRLLKEEFENTRSRVLSAVDKLQTAAGVAPGLRVRVQGTVRYTKDFGLEPMAVDEPHRGPGEAHSDRLEVQPLAPAMTAAEAVQWFQNRKDDARLIEEVFPQRSSLAVHQVKSGVRLMRGLIKRLLADDSNATLRAFLNGFSSQDDEESVKATQQVSAFVARFARPATEGHRLSQALRELRHLADQYLPVMDDRPADQGPSGTAGIDLLPPQDIALIERLDTSSNARRAAKDFAVALLEKRVGGLSEWISMASDERHFEAKRLLEEVMTSELKAGMRGQIRPVLKLLLESKAAHGAQGDGGGATGKRTRADEGSSGATETTRASAQAVRRQRTARHVAAASRLSPDLAAPAPDRHLPLSAEEATVWHRNRLQDDALVDPVLVRMLKTLGVAPTAQAAATRGLRKFARALADASKADNLRAFLKRTKDLKGDKEQDEHEEVVRFLSTLGDAVYDQEEARGVKLALKLLRHIPAKERKAKRAGASTSLPALRDSGRLRWTLPPRELALIKRVEIGTTYPELVRFSSELLLHGHGGLTGWLEMPEEPRSKLTRELLLEKLEQPRNKARCILALKRISDGEQGLRIPGGAGSRAAGAARAIRPIPWNFDLAQVPRRVRTAREAVPVSPGDAGAVQALAVDEVDDIEVVPGDAMKQEPSGIKQAASAAPPPVYVEAEMLDQARTAFYRELELCDLSSDIAEWRLHLNPNDATVVRHRPAPMSENDHKFPLRDPADPLRRVHPRYAGPDGKCDPNVRIRDIRLGSGFTRYIRELVKTDTRLRIDPRGLPALIQRLEKDAMDELERLIQERPGPARCQPRLLRKEDVLPHEQVLIGQYGLFVQRPEVESEIPTLSNGRILGFYMGALISNDDDLARTTSDHPDYELYAIDTFVGRRPVTYSGKGAANSVAFANTALKADGGEAAYDTKRINAIFVDFSAGFSDRQGKPARESLVAMVALDNLFDSDQDEAQVLVDYGDAFLQHFRGDSGHGESASTSTIKTEPEPQR
ncbi:MAG TPA: hypothetical protein VFP68_00440 [Burkholderiaceae bacterium]|nr:hypothetical protein [Burkholderiaceae bacterium]